jgi:hypothetical protein
VKRSGGFPRALHARLCIVVSAIAMLATASLPSVKPKPADSSGRVGYSWWVRASDNARLFVVASTIEGIRVGWLDGVYRSQKVTSKFINDVNLLASIAQAFPQMDAPEFSKTPAAYRLLVDKMYATKVAARKHDVPDLLLCLADTPIGDCKW